MAFKQRNTFGVFVGNLPQHSSEVMVGQLFSRFGQIESIRVMETKKGYPKIAFVNFSCRSDAERAIKERDGYIYCGRPLNVSIPTSCKSRERETYASEGGLNDLRTLRHRADPDAEREEEIVLTQVESPVSFFAHLLRQKHWHRQLSLDMAEICPRLTCVADKPLIDKVYGARFSEDGQWYRCRILSNDFHDKSYVHYIDYGNGELVSHAWLVELPRDLSSPPAMALRCRLRDLVAVDRELHPAAHAEGVSYLREQLRDRVVVVRMRSRSDGAHEVVGLVVGDTDLFRQVVRLGYALCPGIGLKPPLEKANGFWKPEDRGLQAVVEELELQLCQERGKVEAATAEVQRISREQRCNSLDLRVVLQDLERVCLLRRQVPILSGDQDYLEEAICIYMDQVSTTTQVSDRLAQFQRVLEGIREVYSSLLQTEGLRDKSFPMTELAAYYRRLKEARRSKCISLGEETDAARHALAGVSSALFQALTSGKSASCPFGDALERLRKCLARELAARALESSDVAVLLVLVSLSESMLIRKIKRTVVSRSRPDGDTEPREPVLPLSREEEPLEDDSDVDDLSSLRQKIYPLSIETV